MPRYYYFCEQCLDEFMITHSMSEDLNQKEGCNSQCDLRRIPQITSTNIKKKEQRKKKTGQIVENFIEDSRHDLKQQKERLKKEQEVDI